MAAPFAACLVLVGIHAYLGIHVLARGVIFVDLALAQIAALGASVGALVGLELGTRGSYSVALAFTFLGAAVFALTRTRTEEHRVPQEAIIGIAYAVASAATVLIMDRSPHGTEHVKDLLVGSILWVTWDKVVLTAALYAAVGAFHWFARRRFLAISFGSDVAGQHNVRLWDFLFYVSFGFVVTSSVQIAGVLLVFCFLIVPSVAAALWAKEWKRRLVIGWVFGTVVSVVGCVVSYVWDLPTGATVVVVFGVALMLLAATQVLRRA
jgi:zinc/manganese transport system permease protein